MYNSDLLIMLLWYWLLVSFLNVCICLCMEVADMCWRGMCSGGVLCICVCVNETNFDLDLVVFKGRVSRDFRPPVFFMIRTYLGHR